MPRKPPEHLDVVVVGAGISGICAGYHLQTSCPGKTYAILEGRDCIGGTWDLFRYPGIRSDSDMFTLGFPFRPWDKAKAIADGGDILSYVRETAAEFGIDQRIRFQHRVLAAAWDSQSATWTLSVQQAAPETKRGQRTIKLTCNFLIMCSGYYRYDRGYTPDFPGRDSFAGTIVHPQFWPEELNYADKKTIVIGSGATAMTLVPSMARNGGRVVLLQRSPTYVVSAPDTDKSVDQLRRILPDDTVYGLVRWRNAVMSQAIYEFSQHFPGVVKRVLRKQLEAQLPPQYDIDTHFKPDYNPWDQRMCLVPNADLFKEIRTGRVEMVTDHIDRFTPTGIRLKSGRELEADIIVTATGLELIPLGNMQVTVDGTEVHTGETMTYKGLMLSDVPNLASVTGYTNASWTLKADLSCAYVCRLINHMEDKGYTTCMPHNNDPAINVDENALGLSAGYILRSLDKLPKQGNKRPWKLYQNYILDVLAMRFSPVTDSAMTFSRPSQRLAA